MTVQKYSKGVNFIKPCFYCMNKKIHIKPKGCNLTAKRGTRIHVDDGIITFAMQVCKAVLCKRRAFTYCYMPATKTAPCIR